MPSAKSGDCRGIPMGAGKKRMLHPLGAAASKAANHTIPMEAARFGKLGEPVCTMVSFGG